MPAFRHVRYPPVRRDPCAEALVLPTVPHRVARGNNCHPRSPNRSVGQHPVPAGEAPVNSADPLGSHGTAGVHVWTARWRDVILDLRARAGRADRGRGGASRCPLGEAHDQPGDGPSDLVGAAGTLVGVWGNGDVRVLDPDTLRPSAGPFQASAAAPPS